MYNLELFLNLVELLWFSLHWVSNGCGLAVNCIYYVFLISPGLLSWRGVRYFQRASLYLMRWSYGISFNLFIWGIDIVCLCMLSHPCISGRKPTWSSWIMFFDVLLDSVSKCFTENFDIIWLMREFGCNSLSWLGLYVV